MTVSPVANVNSVDRTQEVQSQALEQRRSAVAKEARAPQQQPEDTVQMSPEATAAMHAPDGEGSNRK